ncbi:MAG: tRNA1(Val) (adenine(37)-N6)-methyltransferase [Clostridia bacterium]|nr:tRNA1(Val) (adenine(37)-N6)-methyltransferase [Clostridia bacterium]
MNEHEMTALLRPGERLDSLSYADMAIIQRPDAFRFGTDAVLLSDFTAVRPRQRVIDLGCGTGVIALLVASREPSAHLTAIEIQPDIADMAARSVAMNEMADRIDVRCLDMRAAARTLGYGGYHVAICNPPYGKMGAALLNPDKSVRQSRHEETCTPDDVCRAGFELLRTGGRLCVIFPAPRAFEMMRAMAGHRLEPKRVRTVHARPDTPPKLILMEAVKDGGEGLHWMPPLVLSDENGAPTDEWKRIYRVPMP